MGYYLHVVPGRMRIKIPLIKGDELKAQQIESILKDLEGVQKVIAQVLTGSVVVHYQSDVITSSEILKVLKQAGYFDESKVITNDQYIQNAVTKAGESLGRALFGLAIERTLQGSGLSLLAALI